MSPELIEEIPIGSYGWRAASPGHAQRYALADTSEIAVLKKVDPTVDMPPIVNQLKLGACTANATARLFRGDTIRDGKDFGAMSRLDIYYDERDIEGDLGQGDTGAFGHDAFIAAIKWGIVPETLWPYKVSTFQTRPTIAEHCGPNQRYWIKKPVKAVNPSLLDAQRVLSNGQKIAVGFSVYPSFESTAVAQHGIIPMPTAEEIFDGPIGGHETVLSGYEPDYPLHLWMDNSWSELWGIGGRCLIPIAYILNRNFASDWRTIQRPIGK